MAKQSASTAVPRLRFPEFRKTTGWKETSLSSVLVEHGEKNDGASEVHSVSVHKGVVNQIVHLGRSFAAADRSNYSLAKPHDIIYTRSPTGEFPYGIIKQSRLPINVIVSPLYGVFSPTSRYLGYILDAYFESPIRTNNYLAPIIQKGAKNTVQISNAVFLSKGLYLPSEEAEQRKIADCLTSLDAVIAAQGRKVEALKAHKRGLMQQLFPREGETRPRLRFPEFRNAPEWREEKVGDLVGTITPPKKLPTAEYASQGRYSIVDQSPAQICGWTDDEEALITLSQPVIIFGDHTCTLKLQIGPFAQGADGIKILLPGSDVSSEFLFQALQVRRIESTEYKRHFSDLKEKLVPVPSRDSGEQDRVADVLSVIDAEITAESNQLAALKTHKQGLMQQLFPSQSELTR